ncbi:MAG: radical SAM protein [Candidatus Coatesbacteria bacterium]|nr:MAG: radical SAM protein [Candidatus Coatesbacteria bacterium]
MAKPEEIYRKLIYATARNLTPLAVMCNLTYRCPLRCAHCYATDFTPGAEELDLAAYRALFDELTAMGTLFLTFSGGEPTLRPDLLDLLAAARERHFAVRLFTGGTLLDEKLARGVGALHPLAVEISLHAATPRLHDEFVGQEGAWEQATAAARRLLRHDVRVVLKMNLMNFNYHEFREVYELTRGLGAEFRYSPYLSVTNDGGTDPLPLRMTDEHLREYFGTLKELVPGLAADGDSCDEEIASPFRYNARALSCLAGFNNCSLDPYGTVWPCVSLPIAWGNVREQSFAAIWEGREAARFRQLPDVPIEECAGCELDRYCFRCPAFALLEEGDIRLPSREHCRVARAAREVLKRPLRR